MTNGLSDAGTHLPAAARDLKPPPASSNWYNLNHTRNLLNVFDELLEPGMLFIGVETDTVEKADAVVARIRGVYDQPRRVVV